MHSGQVLRIDADAVTVSLMKTVGTEGDLLVISVRRIDTTNANSWDKYHSRFKLLVKRYLEHMVIRTCTILY